jgi:hypothetical protein
METSSTVPAASVLAAGQRGLVVAIHPPNPGTIVNPAGFATP